MGSTRLFSFLIVLTCLAGTSGCAVTSMIAGAFESMGNAIHSSGEASKTRTENREALREMRYEVRQKEQEAERAALRAERQALVDEARRELNQTTVPELESKLSLQLRQRFTVGSPEVDIEEMREVLKVAEDHHKERMAGYRESLKEYHELEKAH